MRLLQHLTEIKEIAKEDIIKRLKKDCKPFLQEIKKAKGFLYRGSSYYVQTMRKAIPRTDRKPTDTPIKLHDQANDFFIKKFGWAGRNGVFASHLIQALQYGRDATGTYLFFPIKEYKFIWSPEIDDFWIDLIDDVGIFDQKYFNMMLKTYIDTDLSKAIDLQGEIMFKCESYYLVHRKYENVIKQEFDI